MMWGAIAAAAGAIVGAVMAQKAQQQTKVTRQHELLAGRGGPFVRTYIRVDLPEPYEDPWWPWFAVFLFSWVWWLA